jgi:hypothetical protein
MAAAVVVAALISCVCLSIVSAETQHCVEINNNVQYPAEQVSAIAVLSSPGTLVFS